MILADTGYLVALLNTRDTLAVRARTWAGVVAEPVLVTEYVLIETVNACSRDVKRERVHAIISLIRHEPSYLYIPGSPDLFDAGLALHSQRSDKAWSLTDCISFVVMQSRGIGRALAHDHHVEQFGVEALLRRDP